MSGRYGENGIGWCHGFDGRDYIMIAVELITDDFDIQEALDEMRRVHADHARAEQEYHDGRERRSADPRLPRTNPVVRPCTVYRFFDRSGRLLYVGKALDPYARQKQHEKRAWWPDVDTLRTTHTVFWSEREALDAEDVAIRDENPLYNRVGGGRA